MRTTLVLEKRGCDFWEWSKEKKESDLENFRLYIRIEKEDKFSDGVFDIEISTHFRESNPFGWNGKVSSFVDITKYIKGDAKIDFDKCFYINPNKKDLLKGINNIFGTSFNQIEIRG